ncbi:MAG: hypothetical protein OEY33_04425 [Bdellovibrionales bacterium]|nr:hypothetical protein [Bdellovibrionales bacterium]
MSKLENLLNSLNLLIEKGVNKSKTSLDGLTPDKVSKKLHSLKDGAIKAKSNLKEMGHHLQEKKEEVALKTSELKKESQKKVSALKSQAKSFDAKKDIPKIGVALVAVIAPFFKKAQVWLQGLKPATVMTATVSSTLVALGGIQAYKMSDSEEEVSRTISSYSVSVEESLKKPSYYQLDKKIFEVPNVKMPVYIESASSMKSLYMDLAFKATNRYIAAYFLKDWGLQQRLILDKINSTIEPIIPELPLNDEGKRIIKLKVIKDVNSLLKELGVKGEIQEVYIKNILAG